jgi:hypothetical protein
MAYACGSVNNTPFEQRYHAPRRRKREPMTMTDRLICAICGSLLGLFLWTTGYLVLATLAMKAVARHPVPNAAMSDPSDLLPPFWWGGVPALLFAGYGTAFGAERMLDGFEKILSVQGKIADAVNRA